jgi:carboxyl-terminal processing protease
MSDNKKNFRISGVILVLATLMLLVGGLVYALSDGIQSDLKSLAKVAVEIDSRYVEKVNPQDLVGAGIKGMLGLLDPYSEFLDKKQLSAFVEETQGEFEGLGIEIDVTKDYIVIVSPLEGTPAYRMGLQAGDKIIEIEGQSTKGISAEEALAKLRGKKGTKVKITVSREGVGEPMEYTITRDVIEIKSVPYYGLTQERVGYIRLNRFAETSAEEIRGALIELQKKNPKGIILDLRGNPGGLLNSAVEIAGFFLGNGKLIVETKGRDITQNRRFYYDLAPICPDLPLVVLVDEGSASASEILAGAIQDWDRGVIVGKATFGKGLVQTLIDLNDGSALKLTTAKYYVPSGRSIQKPTAKEEDTSGMFGIPEQPPDTSKSKQEKEKFYTKKGRLVFGGGGVIPDVEVEGEEFNSLKFNLLRQQMFFEFALSYTAYHKNIAKDFVVDDRVLVEFREFLKSKHFELTTAYQLEFDKLKQSLGGESHSPNLKAKLEGLEKALEEEKENEFDKSKEYIKWKIKEEIVAKLYGREATYEYVWVKWHPEILKGIELITTPSKYQELLSVKQ